MSEYKVSAKGNVQVGEQNTMSVSGPTTVQRDTTNIGAGTDVLAALAALSTQLQQGHEAIRAMDATIAELRAELEHRPPRRERLLGLLRLLGAGASDVTAITAAAENVQHMLGQAT
jgi:hypothetical protein